jgi:hypothetical protein
MCKKIGVFDSKYYKDEKVFANTAENFIMTLIFEKIAIFSQKIGAIVENCNPNIYPCMQFILKKFFFKRCHAH